MEILVLVDRAILSVWDFENYSTLGKTDRAGGPGIYRERTFQRAAEHALLRQETWRTEIAQVGEAEVKRYPNNLGRQPKRRVKLTRVMHQQHLVPTMMRMWLCHQLIKSAFIDQWVRLIARSVRLGISTRPIVRID